jgi:hypothetical protein
LTKGGSVEQHGEEDADGRHGDEPARHIDHLVQQVCRAQDGKEDRQRGQTHRWIEQSQQRREEQRHERGAIECGGSQPHLTAALVRETPQAAMPGPKPGEYIAPCKQTK